MDRGEEDDHIGPKTLILTICAAKIAVIGIVLVEMHDTEGIVFAAIVSWYWIVPAAFILGGPAIFRYRLHRVRARRERLVRSEWSQGSKLQVESPIAPLTER